MSSSSGGGNYSKSTSSPYQSQLYDSWKTEWNAPTFSYDQQYNRSGGVSSGDDDRHQRNDERHERGRSQHNGRQSASSYMTKGNTLLFVSRFEQFQFFQRVGLIQINIQVLAYIMLGFVLPH